MRAYEYLGRIIVHSRFPITRSSSIGGRPASSARGIPSIFYLLLSVVMRIIWCVQSVSQWCHVNNCIYIVIKRIKKFFASIQHGIDSVEGMYPKYLKYNSIIIKIYMLIRCIFEYSITHVVLITIISCVKLYIMINCNYIKCSYILFKKGEFHSSTVMCEISKFPKNFMQF